MSTFVVGVDGSKGSVEALRRAIDEARLHGARVKAVNAWHVPPILYEAGWAPLPIELNAYPKAAQEVLDRSLRGRSGGVRSRGDDGRARGAGSRCDLRGGKRRRSPHRRLTRFRRLSRLAARLGQPAVRSPRPVPKS